MLEPFQLPFVQRGIAEVLVLAVAGGLIGTWIVLRGLAFYSHAVGTAAFPGLVLADGPGLHARCSGPLPPPRSSPSRSASLRAARERTTATTASPRSCSSARSRSASSSPATSSTPAPSVETLLFGSLLLVDGGDIAFAAVAAVVVLAGTAVLGQRWLATGFDPRAARALGARSALPDAVLLVLVALVAVAALSTLGALLATALLVVPAATTRLVCTRLRTWQLATVALVGGRRGRRAFGCRSRSTRRPARRSPCSPAARSCSSRCAAVLRRRARGRGAALVRSPAAAPTPAAPGPARSRSSRARRRSATWPAPWAATAPRSSRLLKPNTDPHDYEPRPYDVVATTDAGVVLESGDGLDRWMGTVVKQSGSDATMVDLGARVRASRRGFPATRTGGTTRATHRPPSPPSATR